MKPIKISLSALQIADFLKASLLGNPDLVLSGLCPLNSAEPGLVTFIRSRSPASAWRSLIKLPEMLVLVEQSLLPEAEAIRSLKCSIVVVPNAQRAFVDLIDKFFEPEPILRGIHPTAIIDSSASIASDVAIGAFCSVGPGAKIGTGTVLHNSVTICRDVSIGRDCEIFSGVVVREGCILGNGCIVHNNSVIGADGFGYLPDPTLGIRKVPQVGIVVVEDRVEIGANSNIDRAAVGSTRIGSGTKIDNQVQIGHNVTIGSNCLICAQVGIAGSATLGVGVVLGGGTGVADHLTIASGVRVGGHSGVTSNLLEPGDYMGMPAVKAGLYRRQVAHLRRLASREAPSAEDDGER
jgi:UDP-3-O-[3-hydroxymyristoyl] glucosamine N-acyltransferase